MMIDISQMYTVTSDNTVVMMTNACWGYHISAGDRNHWIRLLSVPSFSCAQM